MKNSTSQQTLTLGQFEHEVLMAVYRLEEDAYSVTIKKELKRRVDKSPALGTISVTLSRLEKRGLLASRLQSAQQRRGRPKRLFRLTPQGAEALNSVHDLHRRLWEGIEQVGLKGREEEA
ncbi:MAG TPA: helix-turn-helix transcriptional regulator [Acidobacteriota bacterium]|nr:helix-turn-helix transcriptional regulator [Acidobacteriota bacterium]